jgi:hypothetical protein
MSTCNLLDLESLGSRDGSLWGRFIIQAVLCTLLHTVGILIWLLFCYFPPYTTQILEVKISISAEVSEEARTDPRKFWSYLHPQLHFNWSSSYGYVLSAPCKFLLLLWLKAFLCVCIMYTKCTCYLPLCHMQGICLSGSPGHGLPQGTFFQLYL